MQAMVTDGPGRIMIPRQAAIWPYDRRVSLRRDPPSGPTVYRRVLGCITLDLTDIENIVRVLREQTAEVRLQAGGATADEAADLTDATTIELHRIVISTLSPTIRVALAIDEATVSTPEETLQAKSLVDDVFYLLSQRKSTGAVVRAVWYPIWLAVWLITSFIAAVYAGNAPFAFLIWALLLPGFIVAQRNFRHMSRSGLATVVPETRSQRRRISQDTRRQIVIGLFIAAFGVFLTIIASH